MLNVTAYLSEYFPVKSYDTLMSHLSCFITYFISIIVRTMKYCFHILVSNAHFLVDALFNGEKYGEDFQSYMPSLHFLLFIYFY